MNYTALDIIHFWTDSRSNLIQKIFPAKGKICVYCFEDLSSEAVKVCNFLKLIIKHPWTFQMKDENGTFVITFFPETVTLETLFQKEHQPQVNKKTPRKERERGARQ